jgi:hypothetical protein
MAYVRELDAAKLSMMPAIEFIQDHRGKLPCAFKPHDLASMTKDELAVESMLFREAKTRCCIGAYCHRLLPQKHREMTDRIP